MHQNTISCHFFKCLGVGCQSWETQDEGSSSSSSSSHYCPLYTIDRRSPLTTSPHIFSHQIMTRQLYCCIERCHWDLLSSKSRHFLITCSIQQVDFTVKIHSKEKPAKQTIVHNSLSIKRFYLHIYLLTDIDWIHFIFNLRTRLEYRIPQGCYKFASMVIRCLWYSQA